MIKTAFYLAAFYIVYSLLLSKDTLYKRNRVYILVSVLVALGLPFVTINTSNPVNIPFFGKTLSEVIITGTSSGIQRTGSAGNWDPARILITIYIAGVILFGCKLLLDLLELIILIAGKKSKGSNIIRFQGLNTSGFSALEYVFINSRLSSEESEEIIKHEQNHIDHYHFFDIIFIEVVKVIQWFNPFIHLFNRSLRAVHEYQADEGCLRKGVPIVSYQSLIMNQVFKSKAFTITNSFSNPTLIKKRMIMMTKKRSKAMVNLKLLLVLPAIAIVMVAFSSCKGKTKPAGGTTVEVPPPPPPPPPPVNEADKPTPYEAVDVMPFFPGGDAALLKYIGDSTKYPTNAMAKNIQGKVVVRFAVEADGSIDRASILKSVDPELDAEAIRVINSLPFFKPGIKDGKPVPVWYAVPITYTLK
jgi:TonB family protein